jgi:RNA polymerase sigma factor (sigma-70 family)
LEATALTHASRRGLLARRSPLLRLQGDENLVDLVRDGNPRAFDAIVDRYQARLLGFCRQMLGSTEDAEDVLQEVFVNAHRAILMDRREIHLRPWLYRIARNRCLNHLRKPVADAQESMDGLPQIEAASTHERAHNREEFRQLLGDVSKLPETQRSALLLREMDALSYEEIARVMDTTVPSVKSLLVRARISLAEASEARLLTCGEVRLELAEAAEGLRKASAPVRRHVRECDECSRFRSQIRSDVKALAALSPIGPLLALKGLIASKLGFGSGGAAAAGTGSAGGAGVAGSAGAVGAGVASSAGAVGGAVGTKALVGVMAATILTAGAMEAQRVVSRDSGSSVETTARTLGADLGTADRPGHVPAKPVARPASETGVQTQTATPIPAPTSPPDADSLPLPAPVSAPPVVDEPVSEPTAAAVVPTLVPASPAPAPPTADGSGSVVTSTPPTPPTPAGAPLTATLADPGAPSSAPADSSPPVSESQGADSKGSGDEGRAPGEPEPTQRATTAPPRGS